MESSKMMPMLLKAPHTGLLLINSAYNAIPATLCGIITGTSMTDSTILFPIKSCLARTYAKGVPRIVAIKVARKEQYNVRTMDSITTGSAAASRKPSVSSTSCRKIMLKSVSIVKRIRREPMNKKIKER